MKKGAKPQQMTPDGQIPTQAKSTDIIPKKKPVDLFIDLPQSEYKVIIS